MKKARILPSQPHEFAAVVRVEEVELGQSDDTIGSGQVARVARGLASG